MAYEAKQNLWLNKDKTEVLTEEPEVGSVLTVKGAAVEEDVIEKHKLDKYVEEVEVPTAESVIKADREANKPKAVTMGKDKDEPKADAKADAKADTKKK